MKITEKTTLGELKNDQLMAPLVPFLVYNRSGDGAGRLTDDSVTLQAIEEKDPAWQADGMAYGLNAFRENAEKGKKLIFKVYEESRDQELSDVSLIFFPAQNPVAGKRKTIVLAAGGAYGAVCSLPESFPVAARLSRTGIDVFCLNYRVADGKTLFPRPMEDMCAAIGFLFAKQNELGIDMTDYAVGGFSAGAHLAACFGTEKLGYMKAGLKKPELMVLVYPLINLWKTTELMPEPVRSMMRKGYLGEDASKESSCPYNVDECLSGNYPSTWMIQSLDDPVVPIWNTEIMEQSLKSNKIPYQYERAAKGGHGWGLGDKTAAAGWTEKMLEFWNELEGGKQE